MPVDERRLYDLLPAVYRVRDAAQAGPLAALLEAVQREADRLGADVAQLYDDWFIETCEEWVVPYIGDLLGVTGISPAADAGYSQRGFVANTIAYRRRKGTAVVLERLARDITGWPAHAVEFFKLLGVTQNVNHVRLGAGGTASLHDATALERIGGPFDPTAHTGEVRHIDNRRGHYNVPDVGVFVWRLQAYPLERTTPALAGGCYRFDPLGGDRILFNRPRTKVDPDDPTQPLGVPEPLSRRLLHDELATSPPALHYFDPDDPVLAVWTNGARISPDRISICDLTDPSRSVPVDHDVAIDPRLGRFVFASGYGVVEPLECSWAYGFPADIGGGPYDRQAAAADAIPDRAAIDWQQGVTRTAPAGSTDFVSTLGQAVANWQALNPPPALAVIPIVDSATYAESVDITVPAGCKLVIIAADCPEVTDPDTGLTTRHLADWVASGQRPCLIGSITVTGDPPTGAEVAAGKTPAAAELVIDGLLIGGSIAVKKGVLGLLRLSNSTLAPSRGGISVEPGTGDSQRNPDLQLELSRAISGPISIHPFVRKLTITDCILDGAGGDALTGTTAGEYGPATEIARSTAFGALRPRSLYASSTLFAAPVDVERRQQGCVRYSYVSLDSSVPRRFRCVPSTSAQPLVPAFVSADYGDPAYAQLAPECPVEILTGAEDGGEIGAYNLLASTQRLASLRLRIDEYLRFGLEAGVFFAT